MSYSSFWGDEKLADLSVLIYEEVPEDTEGACETVLAHKIVLAANSSVIAAQLLEWPSETSRVTDCSVTASTYASALLKALCRAYSFIHEPNNSSPLQQLQLAVPAGHLELGRQLLKAMYADVVDLSGLSCRDLVHLLVLADRYAVQRVAEAVCNQVAKLSANYLPWDALVAVYQLPETLSNLPEFKTVYDLAAATLKSELGDLEVAWADAEKQKQLLSLPFAAMKQLLSDPDTRVRSENTVAYTIQKWVDANASDSTQLAQLIALVRMAHCSLPYIATVIFNPDSCFSNGLTQEELHVAMLCPSLSLYYLGHCKVLHKFPNWCRSARPASALNSLNIDWSVPLSDLEQAVRKHLLKRCVNPTLYSRVRITSGRQVYGMLQVTSQESDTTSQVTTSSLQLGCYVKLKGCQGQKAVMSVDIRVLTADKRSSASKRFTNALIEGVGVGWTCMVDLGQSSNWSEVDRQLRDAKLVHDDGNMHFQIVVSDIQ